MVGRHTYRVCEPRSQALSVCVGFSVLVGAWRRDEVQPPLVELIVDGRVPLDADEVDLSAFQQRLSPWQRRKVEVELAPENQIVAQH